MYLGITRYPVILLVCYIEGSIYPPTEPDHQIFLTQITNHQKKPQKSLYHQNIHVLRESAQPFSHCTLAM